MEQKHGKHDWTGLVGHGAVVHTTHACGLLVSPPILPLPPTVWSRGREGQSTVQSKPMGRRGGGIIEGKKGNTGVGGRGREHRADNSHLARVPIQPTCACRQMHGSFKAYKKGCPPQLRWHTFPFCLHYYLRIPTTIQLDIVFVSGLHTKVLSPF